MVVRAASIFVSLGVHAALFGVVGALVAGQTSIRDPELIAGGASASGSFALTTVLEETDEERPPTPPAPPAPYESSLPQPELRSVDELVAEVVVAPPPLAPCTDELDELPLAAAAESGAPDAALPFGFEPVATRLLPLRLGPSRPPRAAAASANGGAAADAPLADAAAPASAPPAPPAAAHARHRPRRRGRLRRHALRAVELSAARARAKGIEGTVVLLAQVDAAGAVTSCEVETSSGSELLDDAARDSLLQWRFKPRLVDGVARSFLARVPFRFSLPPREPTAKPTG
jgi:protein TonB